MINLKVNRNLSLRIENQLISTIAKVGIKHFPNEIGGFLIGHYSDNHEILFIDDFLLPKIYTSSPTIFERKTEGMEEEFSCFYKNKKQYFIGEWHTHPNGSSKYSQTDLNSMIEIKNCETVNILNPLLLILSVNQKDILEYSFYLLNNNRLNKYG